MNVDDVLLAKRLEILHLAARRGARNVRVFGSVARGEAGAEGVERNCSKLHDG